MVTALEPEKTASLAEALALLQTRLPRIEKSQKAKVDTKTGGSYSYSYADLSNITDKLLPIMGALGLSFTCKPTFSGDRFVLAYKLLHVGGDSEEGEYPLPTGGTPQALGSAITYGRRYVLGAITGIAPEDDDDAAAAQADAMANRGTAQRSQRPAAGTAAANTSGATAQRAQPPAGPPPLPSDEDRITRPQLSKIQAQFGELGHKSPDAKRQFVEGVLDRPVTSLAELSKVDAGKVIDALDAALELAGERAAAEGSGDGLWSEDEPPGVGVPRD